jgi:hypothetical protein
MFGEGSVAVSACLPGLLLIDSWHMLFDALYTAASLLSTFTLDGRLKPDAIATTNASRAEQNEHDSGALPGRVSQRTPCHPRRPYPVAVAVS